MTRTRCYYFVFGCLLLALWLPVSCAPTQNTEPGTEPNPEQTRLEPSVETSLEPTSEPVSPDRNGAEPVVDLPKEPPADAGNPIDGPDTSQDTTRDNPPETPPEQTSRDRDTTTPDTATGPCNGQSHRFTVDKETITLTCTQRGPLRTYALQTTHSVRDNLPPNGRQTVTEAAGTPYLRSGHLLFDSLYAMAVQEAKQNSVSQVKEGAFQNGTPYPCSCFQTGEKWTWAWTRDSAYAIDLGLAALDPVRSFNTLMFKISKKKAGAVGTFSPQIVQDTGTGGSWPVSSDRVVWATGLRQLLHFQVPAVATQVFAPLWQTIQHDRRWIFDAADGLYRGEQSFLDWREQSYPSWSKERIETIAMSKALSTNVNHLVALLTATELAQETGETAAAAQLGAWTSSLRTAIAKGFKLTGTPLLSTMKTHTLAPAPAQRFDLLGNALAILFDVVDEKSAAAIVAAYPHSQAGPPVQWPQQPLTPIYHNRAIWPFVTAYWLRAAKKVQNAAVVTHNLQSLYRGAAINLSHMENFEYTTLANFYKDGAYSGPVINSRRQLWSVAGYLSAVQDIVFGMEASRTGASHSLRWRPFLTRALRQAWFPKASQITLYQFSYRGKTLDITLQLPPVSTDAKGAYTIGSIALNGKVLTNPTIPVGLLQASNKVTIELKQPTTPIAGALTIVEEKGDFRNLWSPKEAVVTKIQEVSGKLTLTIDAQGEVGTEHKVYRDGVQVAAGIKAGTWVDAGFSAQSTSSPCYTVVAVFPTSGNHAHHSEPKCWLGVGGARLQVIDVWQMIAKGGSWGYGPGGEGLYNSWGAATDTLEARAWRSNWTGTYNVRLRYRNPSGSTSTGITAATKRVVFIDEATQQIAASGMLHMPQSGNASDATSTLFQAKLDASKRYTVRLVDPAELVNMSYLSHFQDYNGGKGGGTKSSNEVAPIAVELWPAQGQDKTPISGNLVVFDGTNDLDKLPKSQVLTPGVTLATWERFGLTWDADWLYLSVVSKGFEQPLKAFIVYLEVAKNSFPTATPATGVSYLQLAPQLPFTPTHFIGLRQKTDNNDGSGPWSGVWAKGTSGWAQQARFKPGRDVFLAADKHTLSARIPRALLGDPKGIRLVGHLVNTGVGQEWKDTIPSGHTPWTAHSKGFLEITLGNNATPSSTWTTR